MSTVGVSKQLHLVANTQVSDERSLLDRACNGDPEAFGALYRKHSTRIYNLCLGMVKDSFLAEDLAQDAFLQAFRRIHTFRGDSQFSTWLYRIAVNAVLMYFRRCKTNPLANADADKDGEEEEPPRNDRFCADDLRLSHSVQRIELERAIQMLPPGYRIMFILHDLEGYEHAEIASLLGCTPGNTKSQLFKARRRLRELLANGQAREQNRAA
jgi:RNA polymerase sigma-70 factor, ECF subfamily